MKNLLLSLYKPQTEIPVRMRLIKTWIIIGLIGSMIPSWRLWFPYDRLFPMVPMFDIFPDYAGIISQVCSVSFVLFGIISLFMRKPQINLVIMFIMAIVLILLDQTRLQPWFFQLSLMLFLISLYNWRVDEPRAYTGLFTNLRIVVAFVYIWSGIQKFNSEFYKTVWPWLIEPFDSFSTPEQISYLSKLGYLIPALEFLAGVLLFFSFTRKFALPFLILMHVFILILIGPTGRNHNPSVWAWNISMIFILYWSFAGDAQSKYYHPGYQLQNISFYIVISMIAIMPVFNLFNRWDSYLSANLYSGNTANGIILLNEKAKTKLPFYLQHFSVASGMDRYTLSVKTWAMHELGVPGYPEKRIYEAVEKELKKITCCEEEIVLHYENKTSLFAFANE